MMHGGIYRGGSYKDSFWRLRLHFFQIVIIQCEDLPTWKIKHPGLSLQMGGKNQGEREWVGREIRNKLYGLGNILMGRGGTEGSLPIPQIRQY